MVKIYPVLYTSVLYPTVSVLDALPGQIQDPPLPVKVDGEDEYLVKRVNDIKYDKRKCKYMYLMKWRGFTKPL